MRTRLGICQGVVVMFEIIAAGGSDGLELVVGQGTAEPAPGSGQRVVKHIVRIIHLIDPENSLQAALIETGVVRHQRQPLDPRGCSFAVSKSMAAKSFIARKIPYASFVCQHKDKNKNS